MSYALAPVIKFRYCMTCAYTTEHIVKPAANNQYHATYICSRCTPLTFEHELTVKRVLERRKFRMCPTCHDLTQIIVDAKGHVICSQCNREEFQKLAVQEGVPTLKILRPSKDLDK